jgi:hypothetical protein
LATGKRHYGNLSLGALGKNPTSDVVAIRTGIVGGVVPKKLGLVQRRGRARALCIWNVRMSIDRLRLYRGDREHLPVRCPASVVRDWDRQMLLLQRAFRFLTRAARGE